MVAPKRMRSNSNLYSGSPIETNIQPRTILFTTKVSNRDSIQKEKSSYKTIKLNENQKKIKKVSFKSNYRGWGLWTFLRPDSFPRGQNFNFHQTKWFFLFESYDCKQWRDFSGRLLADSDLGRLSRTPSRTVKLERSGRTMIWKYRLNDSLL